MTTRTRGGQAIGQASYLLLLSVVLTVAAVACGDGDSRERSVDASSEANAIDDTGAGDQSNTNGGDTDEIAGCRYYTHNPSVEQIIADWTAFRQAEAADGGRVVVNPENELDRLGVLPLFETIPSGAVREFGRTYCLELHKDDAMIKMGTKPEDVQETLKNYAESPVVRLTDALYYCRDDIFLSTEGIIDDAHIKWMESFASLIRETVCP